MMALIIAQAKSAWPFLGEIKKETRPNEKRTIWIMAFRTQNDHYDVFVFHDFYSSYSCVCVCAFLFYFLVFTPLRSIFSHASLFSL